jgi:hypothetical protein
MTEELGATAGAGAATKRITKAYEVRVALSVKL